MKFGLSLPAKTFMPEDSKKLGDDYNAFENLIYGYGVAKKLGYDYIEAAVGAVNDLSDNELIRLKELVDEGKFSLEICNCFIPADIRMFQVPFKTIEDFVEKSMFRMSSLNVKTVVFGSGAARMRPDGIDISAGNDFLKKFLTLCGNIGSKYGISTSLEQLNSTETNLINTVKEGASLVRELNLSNVFLLADVFHMSIENEDFTSVSDNLDIISHFHVSEAPGRVFPGKFRGDYIQNFLSFINSTDTDKDITVECVFDDFESEARSALEFLKEKIL